jgi:hypothetical protein
MASRSRDIGTANRSTRSRTAKGEAVTRGATNTGGGTPAAAAGASPEEIMTQDRLSQQRAVAAEKEQAPARTEAAAERALPEGQVQTSGIFTAVCRNGLSHRRNGIIFGAEPTTVDVSGWNDAEKQRFFNDSMLMIVPGQHLGARGAILAPSRSFPATMTGGGGENATPEMLAALNSGQAMAHPATGAANPVVGSHGVTPAVRDLERELSNRGGGEK